MHGKTNTILLSKIIIIKLNGGLIVLTNHDTIVKKGVVLGWGTCVHPWWINVDVWQNQYNIVK